LDEIRRGGRVPAPENWLSPVEVVGGGGVFGFLVGCSSSKNGEREGRGDSDDRRSLKGVTVKGSGVGGPVGVQPSGGRGVLATAHARAMA
jgi:hypothetical protein